MSQSTHLKSQFLEPRFYVAALTGFVFGAVAVRFWGWYAVDNSITNWLLDEFANKGRGNLFQAFAWVHDFVINFLLALPVAGLLFMLVPKRSMAPIWAAVVGLHLALFWDAEFSSFGLLFQHPGFWVGLVTSISVIPLAYHCVRATANRVGD